MADTLDALKRTLSACTLCADRFAATHTAHAPNPVVWFDAGARILICGQAPGMRVHKAGKPFYDPSGDRLRDWMGVTEDEFYDRSRVGVLPMAFCFPGYNAKGSDLPPPKICARTWHTRIMDRLPTARLTLLIGGYAQAWHLGVKTGVTDAVAGWRAHAPDAYPLPHPSWRNTGWLKKNPWFEADLLPVLRARVREVMDGWTPLDAAHAAMETGGDAGRLRFFDRLADAELFLLLAAEPDRDQIEPEVFETEDGSFVLVFDREDRLTAFVGKPAPYAALSGRVLVGMLAGQGIGLGLNLEVAPSSMLLPAEAIAWLHETLGQRPTEVGERPVEVRPPSGLPEALLTALDAKLATAAGLARLAYLVSVTYSPARPGHLLAVIDPVPGAEPALAQAVGEALVFSGIEAGEIDIGFFAASDPMAARLAKVGLRFDLPQIEASPDGQPVGPGMDPKKPPKLR